MCPKPFPCRGAKGSEPFVGIWSQELGNRDTAAAEKEGRQQELEEAQRQLQKERASLQERQCLAERLKQQLGAAEAALTAAGTTASEELSQERAEAARALQAQKDLMEREQKEQERLFAAQQELREREREELAGQIKGLLLDKDAVAKEIANLREGRDLLEAALGEERARSSDSFQAAQTEIAGLQSRLALATQELQQLRHQQAAEEEARQSMSSAAEERKAELLDLQRKLKTSTEEIQALQISAADAKQECDRFELALAAKEVREAELHAKIQKLQEEWDVEKEEKRLQQQEARRLDRERRQESIRCTTRVEKLEGELDGARAELQRKPRQMSRDWRCR
ncbi:unnamed protein product [Effrenium voratum]|nr:unnamed protein product [Effrenium voratum]